jgi:hypothetical protein
VVFLNHGAWQRPVWHGKACAPAGFMPLPSIAYRLARIAVGDGIATMTLRPVNALDIAAGHALLMAAGGVLLAEDGAPVTYNELGESRPSACFGGSPSAVEALRARMWRGSQEPRRENRVTLTWPRLVPEAMLDRAAGCLFGLAIGGDLGPDTELAVIVARALLGRATYDRAAIDAAVRDWIAAGGAVGETSVLARAIPIGIWACNPDMAAAAARLDAPEEPRCGDLAALIAAAIGGASRQEIDLRFAALTGGGGTAITLYPPLSGAPSGSIVPAPAIRAAIDGAMGGRCLFPTPRVMRVLTWRPDEGLGVARPRPEICWTDDLVDLAEALLCQGQRTREPA